MTPNELAVEHVRNILQAFELPTRYLGDGLHFTPDGVAAIVVRLRKVLAELERPVITLMAEGDHIVQGFWNMPPMEAASGTDEDYGSPILPPAQQDGAAFRGQEPE